MLTINRYHLIKHACDCRCRSAVREWILVDHRFCRMVLFESQMPVLYRQESVVASEWDTKAKWQNPWKETKPRKRKKWHKNEGNAVKRIEFDLCQSAAANLVSWRIRLGPSGGSRNLSGGRKKGPVFVGLYEMGFLSNPPQHSFLLGLRNVKLPSRGRWMGRPSSGPTLGEIDRIRE